MPNAIGRELSAPMTGVREVMTGLNREKGIRRSKVILKSGTRSKSNKFGLKDKTSKT